MRVGHLDFEFVKLTPEQEAEYAFMAQAAEFLRLNLERSDRAAYERARTEARHLEEDRAAERHQIMEWKAARSAKRAMNKMVRAMPAHLRFDPSLELANPHTDWLAA